MRLAPAVTGSGASVKLIDTSAEAATVVVAVALLLAVFGSVVTEEVLAVAVNSVPAAVPEGTPTTMVTSRVAALAVAPVQVQLTVPLAPTAGLVQLPPAPGVAETKVVVAASGKEITTSVAGPLPPLVTVAA